LKFLKCERRDGVLIARFRISHLVGEDLIEQVARELYKLPGEAAAYGGKLLLSFEGVAGASSAMLGKLITLNKRCRHGEVVFRICELPPDLHDLFSGGDPTT